LILQYVADVITRNEVDSYNILRWNGEIISPILNE